MLTVDEALRLILERAEPLTARRCAAAEALGRVLAEDVASDVDSPPHDKAMVDGYAVRAADLPGGSAELTILEEVVAGAVPTQAISPGTATRVMTGAPIPAGADAMVMIERSEPLAYAGGVGCVRIVDPQLRAGQNIMRRAESMQRGQIVLTRGHRLRAIELGLLAEVGRTSVSCVSPPTVAILSTGNELVAPDKMPGPGQIRNSNEPLLVACVERAGAVARGLGIARDERDALRQAVARGLESDVLVLSGGVSAGVLDLVPSVLAECGVEQVFHKVRLKPGKPIWFGVRPAAGGAGRRTLVFGLPGNPVSSFVCFELFVRPAIARLSGRADVSAPLVRARLTREFTHRGDRPTYHPAILRPSSSFAPEIEPLASQGSADLAGLARANALACFPAGDRTYTAGDTIDVRPMGD